MVMLLTMPGSRSCWGFEAIRGALKRVEPRNKWGYDPGIIYQ
jgi:hypothetical protein